MCVRRSLVLLVLVALAAVALVAPVATSQLRAAGPIVEGWVSLSSPAAPLLIDVFAVDADHAWAVGYSGTIVATADGGRTWQKQASGTTNRLSGVWFTDSLHGWIVGGGLNMEPRVFLATSDGGSNWQAVDSPAVDRFTVLTHVQFTDATHGFAFGGDGALHHGFGGNLLVTDDGGDTWTPRSLEAHDPGVSLPDLISDVWFTDAQHGWAVGDRYDTATYRSRWGAIWATKDGGRTWTDQSPGLEGRFNAVCFANAQHGWAVGHDNAARADKEMVSVAFETSDGGTTWTRRHVGDNRPGDSFGQVSVNASGYGWIVGKGSSIWVTYDSGVTWALRKRVKIMSDPSAISIVGQGRGYMVGDGGLMAGIEAARPVTRAPWDAQATAGGRAVVRFRIEEAWPSSGTAKTWIEVRNGHGRVVLTTLPYGKPVNVPVKSGFACTLPPGTYRFSVYAQNFSGSTASVIGSNRLIVR
jgi:photosystem II stability/assembly factor-like uncharacterized protein